MEEDEGIRMMAQEILVEAGCLEECEDHSGTFTDGGHDVEYAYRLANAKITARSLLLPDRISQRDFTDIVKSVYDDNNGSECYSCNKIANE